MKTKKPKLKLVGEDGNVFNIIGMASMFVFGFKDKDKNKGDDT